MPITKEELAALIGNPEYRNEVSLELASQAEANRLVIVHGASDDLVEFRGAIHDECGDKEVRIDGEGLVPDYEEAYCRPSYAAKDALREFFRREKAGNTIRPVWDRGDGVSWSYETTIPHATFNVMEDGEIYCIGIVFSLDDLQPAAG